ncbi:hypothetical protein [Kineosporia sp. NBRC 101731]|uniref:hypothetical protein n=1 Tax=Kineosporia sp. NBRC 101731 TaxID=3032199 RepID=UPI0024A12309|nr:hypothetical protein [Kineosporia sp. NBRC 101731]GLY33396.1 hypothetical protein Kisp02_67610 [Kineosporia sp. NBRC 101731]
MGPQGEVLEAITLQIVAVERSLTHERIRQVVTIVFGRRHPLAVRTHDQLKRSPALLTEQNPHTPPAVQRLILQLIAAGAQSVHQPRCATCGEVKVLLRLLPAGRSCAACARLLQQRRGECSRCHKQVQIASGPDGCDYCKKCWRTMKPAAPEAIVAATRRHRRIAAAKIGAALAAVSADRHVRLMLELQVHGGPWFEDPAAGSNLFAAFYDLLREHGARLPQRTCGHCPSTRTLTERLQRRISCRRCYRAAHARTCGMCGDLANIERVLSDGTRLCQRCTNQLPDQKAHCSGCGAWRLIAYHGERAGQGPLCSTCRTAAQLDRCTRCATIGACRFAGTDQAICLSCTSQAQMDVCTICGNRRHCRWAGTTRAVCDLCASPRHPCRSCGEIRLRHKRDPGGEGYLCWACTPPIIETCTSCGADRIVNGRIDQRPYCPTCYPKQPETFRPCSRCATVTRLVGKLCPRCRAENIILQLIPDDLAATDEAIARLRQACLTGPARKIIYAFEHGTLACTLLGELLRHQHLRTHAHLDDAGSRRQTSPVRSLLVDHGLLPWRDESLARFEAWTTQALATLTDPDQHRVLTQYVRWRHLRQLRAAAHRPDASPVRAAQLIWRRNEITVALELLTWAQQQGLSLQALSQHHIDRRQAQAPAPLHHFLAWTSRHDHTQSLSAPVRPSAGRNPHPISDAERWRLIAGITADPSIEAHLKFAAGLMLIFGLRAAQIVRLRPQQITTSNDAVVINLGSAPLVLPLELAPFAQQAADDRTARRMFTSGRDDRWLFPSYRAGHHLNATTLNLRLKKAGVPPRQARAGALNALTQQLPPAVLARLTGLNVATCVAWSTAIGANTSTYAAAVTDMINIRLPEQPHPA